MEYILFDKRCSKCVSFIEEVKMPKEEFNKLMNKRKIGDDSLFKCICDKCK